MKFEVTLKSKRPASNKNECFYCESKIGEFHKDDCVLIKKKVKVKAIIEYEIEVPHHWNKDMIEFSRNEGSWCASNIINELKEIDKKNGCLCNIIKYKLIKDSKKIFLDE